MTTPRLFGLSPGWARATLVASIGLNFLLIGLVVGATMKSQETPRRGWGGYVSQQIVDLAKGPSSDDVRRLMEERRDTIMTMRAARNESWRVIIGDLGAQPFEPAKLHGVLTDQVARRNAARTESYAMMAEAIALLTDAERMALAARIETYMKERAKRRR